MFQQGLSVVLSRWTALDASVKRAPRYIDVLEDLLDENLIQQFYTEAEDGSIEEVAEKLMAMYEDCLEGNFETIRELSSNNTTASHSTFRSQQMRFTLQLEWHSSTRMKTMKKHAALLDNKPETKKAYEEMYRWVAPEFFDDIL